MEKVWLDCGSAKLWPAQGSAKGGEPMLFSHLRDVREQQWWERPISIGNPRMATKGVTDFARSSL